MSYLYWGFVWFYWFAVFAIPILLVTIVPLAFWACSSVGSKRRRVFGTIVSYLIIASTLGLFAYLFIPAEYTRGHFDRWPPASSSLWEIHSVQLDRTANPEAISPENAPRIRQMVYEERSEYFRTWLTFALVGLVVVIVVVCSRGLIRRQIGEQTGGG